MLAAPASWKGPSTLRRRERRRRRHCRSPGSSSRAFRSSPCRTRPPSTSCQRGLLEGPFYARGTAHEDFEFVARTLDVERGGLPHRCSMRAPSKCSLRRPLKRAGDARGVAHKRFEFVARALKCPEEVAGAIAARCRRRVSAPCAGLLDCAGDARGVAHKRFEFGARALKCPEEVAGAIAARCRRRVRLPAPASWNGPDHVPAELRTKTSNL